MDFKDSVKKRKIRLVETTQFAPQNRFVSDLLSQVI